jgi:hypothetical protein
MMMLKITFVKYLHRLHDAKYNYFIERERELLWEGGMERCNTHTKMRIYGPLEKKMKRVKMRVYGPKLRFCLKTQKHILFFKNAFSNGPL